MPAILPAIAVLGLLLPSRLIVLVEEVRRSGDLEVWRSGGRVGMEPQRPGGRAGIEAQRSSVRAAMEVGSAGALEVV
jgi:hypothetical protein